MVIHIRNATDEDSVSHHDFSKRPPLGVSLHGESVKLWSEKRLRSQTRTPTPNNQRCSCWL